MLQQEYFLSQRELNDPGAMTKDAYQARKRRLQVRQIKVKLDSFFTQIFRRDFLCYDDHLLNQFFCQINDFMLKQLEYFELKLKNLKEESKVLHPQQVDQESHQNTKKQLINLINQHNLTYISQEQYSEPIIQFEEDQEYKVEEINKKKMNKMRKSKKIDYQFLAYPKEEYEEKFKYREKFVKVEDEKFRCLICEFIIDELGKCQQHYIQFHSQQQYKCTQCHHEFSCWTDLFTHDYVMHRIERSEKKDVNICEFCGTVLCSIKGYRQHILRMHIEKLKPQIEAFKLQYNNTFEGKLREVGIKFRDIKKGNSYI